MIVHCNYDELVETKKLKAHPDNKNKHPKDQIERLAKILEYQGWRYPIKVSKQTGYITSGHGRLEAAKLMGWKDVPVNYQDYKDHQMEYADVQSDNAIASWAELDLSGIHDDLKDFEPDFDIDLLGIENFEIEPADKYADKSDEQDNTIPDNAPTRVKPGEIWQLGEHRLMCGDATKDVDVLLDGAKIDMVYTDPPYGINLNADYSKRAGGGRTFENIQNDNTPYDASFIVSYFKNTKEMFLWGPDNYCHTIPNYLDGVWICWEKKHEKADTTHQGAFELCWSKVRHRAEICRVRWLACDTDIDSKSRQHPTQKPVALTEWFFDKHGSKTKTVADLYGGSGSTLIACEKTNRKCYMMEIEPKYCDVILKRWEDYTGEKAKRIEK